MRINESTIRRIIREEARQVLRENFDLDQIYEYSEDELLSMLDKLKSGRQPDGADLDNSQKILAIGMIEDRLESLEEEEEEEEISARPHKTVEDVINDLMDKGAKNWSRVSNDFHAMSDGERVAQDFYPGLSASDFGKIARKLDAHFNY